MEFFGYFTCLVFAGLPVEHIHLLFHQVRKSDNFALVNDRDLQRTNLYSEFSTKGVIYAAESRLVIIKAIDEESRRQMCFLCLLPGELCTDLNTAFAIHEDHSGICDTDALTHLPLEIKIAGCIQYVDLYVMPHNGSDGSLQRETAACLLGIVVRNCITGGNRAEPIRRFGDIQHCLGERCFPAPAMTKQDDIPNLFCLNRSHVCLLFRFENPWAYPLIFLS